MTPYPGFKVTVLFKVKYLKNSAFLSQSKVSNTKTIGKLKMVPLLMTLGDPDPKFQSHSSIF